jgi:hypothetical protein
VPTETALENDGVIWNMKLAVAAVNLPKIQRSWEHSVPGGGARKRCTCRKTLAVNQIGYLGVTQKKRPLLGDILVAPSA